MSGAYIELGLDHILDPKGLDHILFIVALCAMYLLTDWKKILILVTAFTIGHSLTLALSVFDLVRVSAELVETLIPVTIIATCLYNIVSTYTSPSMLSQQNPRRSDSKDFLDIPQRTDSQNTVEKNKSITANYAIALLFGLIHGLGFSNFFKAMLGRDESIIAPLLSFNVGVELGQVVIVLATLIVSFVLVDLLGLQRRYYSVGLSGVIGVWALIMILG